MRYFTNKGEIEENTWKYKAKKKKTDNKKGSDIIHCSALHYYNSKNFDHVATLLQILIMLCWFFVINKEWSKPVQNIFQWM